MIIMDFREDFESYIIWSPLYCIRARGYRCQVEHGEILIGLLKARGL